MSILAKLLGIKASDTIDAVGNVIDKIDNSEEKLSLQLKYKELLLEMSSKLLDYENKLLESQTELIKSESSGGWMQRNWRPILMFVCIFIVFNNYVLVPYFRLPSMPLDENIWSLIQVGVGGYIAGRSLEKMAVNVGDILKKK
jgi:hypothetical protein